jgi:hypothetical protein
MLRDVFRANALFSAITGIALIVGAGPIASLMGQFAPIILVVVGVGLLPFAGMVLYVSTQERIKRSVAFVIIALDALWVLGSIAGLLTSLFPLTTAGTWIVLLVADAVADFAALQLYAVFVQRKDARKQIDRQEVIA